MQTFISLSGGVESTTMCILYGENAKAIWCDTGSEHKKMYERINHIESMIKNIHPNFEVIKIKPKVKAKGVDVNSLEDYCIESKVMPSGQMRFCTRAFKIEPIDDFLLNQRQCELMIGFNADEEPGLDRTGNFMKCKNVSYLYPLYEDGFTRSDCEIILNQYNLHPNFPAYMSRGGCRMCFFKSEKEYRAMYFLNRDEFNEVMDFEEKIQDRRGKFYSIMQSGKSLRMLANSLSNPLFSKDEIVKEYESLIKKNTSCGAFCHR